MEVLDQTVIVAVGVSVIVIIAVIFFLFVYKDSNESKKGEDVSVGLRKEEVGGSLSGTDTGEKILNPATFKQFKVLQVIKVSHNTKLIRFEIPHGKPLGLPIGRHVSVRADIDGNKVIRAYTPTSRPDQTGYFDLLIKTYEFGKMSQHLHTLRPGSSLEVRGPVGRFKYVKNSIQKMGLIAGGNRSHPPFCYQ